MKTYNADELAHVLALHRKWLTDRILALREPVNPEAADALVRAVAVATVEYVYERWRVSPTHIGEPIRPMVELAKKLIADGKNVAILTARASVPKQRGEAIPAIERWCKKHLGRVVPITTRKDYGMVACYDDRATQVVPNDGRLFVHPDAQPDPGDSDAESSGDTYVVATEHYPPPGGFIAEVWEVHWPRGTTS